jgi:alkanesulfonate monooxygenase
MSIAFTLSPSLAAAEAAEDFFFNPDTYREQLILADRSGFSSVVVDHTGGALANLDVAANVARATDAMTIIVTHLAGVIAPTVSARQLAYLDRLTEGRLALRFASGGLDEGLTSHEAGWRQTDEYLTLLKRLWSNVYPFDHEGEFYSVRAGYVPEKGPQGLGISLRIAATTGVAMRVAARHADVVELVPGPVQDVANQIERVRSLASGFGRANKIRFAVPVTVEQLVAGRLHGSVQQPALAERAVLALLPYVEAGASEFMIGDLRTAETMRFVADEIGDLLRNSARRIPAPRAVRWHHHRHSA